MEANTSYPAENTAPQSEKTLVEKKPYRYLMLGIWLMALGAVWLLWNLRVVNLAWIERYGFIIFGAILLTKTILLKKYHLFWGGTFLLIGLFHVYLDLSADLGMRELWPMYLLIAGTTFIANFLVDVKRWFSLVAGMFLMMFGGIYLSRTFFMMPYDLVLWIRSYWPLTFVAAGIILVVIALIKGHK
jgi:hypothetical protein